ncbi:MAG: hypothetical protein ABIK25_07210 [Pseudomonadota bacterium]
MELKGMPNNHQPDDQFQELLQKIRLNSALQNSNVPHGIGFAVSEDETLDLVRTNNNESFSLVLHDNTILHEAVQEGESLRHALERMLLLPGDIREFFIWQPEGQFCHYVLNHSR